MANLVRRSSDYRDPMGLARAVLGFDPFTGLEWPALRTTSQDTFNPAFEVIEREDAYVFTADVPGIKEPDIDVTVENGQLIVSGARSAEERREGENYFLHERRFGNFTRAFKLPDNVDDGKIDAALDGGVLTVTIGKRESAKPRKIPFGRRTKS